MQWNSGLKSRHWNCSGITFRKEAGFAKYIGDLLVYFFTHPEIKLSHIDTFIKTAIYDVMVIV
jgi:hypothetical protein